MAPVRSAPLVDSVQLIADAAGAANQIPPAQTITIANAGSYTLTLTDLQLPAALGSLGIAIATSTDSLITLNGAGTKNVTLPAGTYTAQALALAAPGAVGGTFSATLTPAAGGAPVWQYEAAVGAANPAPSTGQSALSAKFSVSASGTYQLNVTDLVFPTALSSLSLIVLNDCGTMPGCVTAPVLPNMNGPNISTPLTLAAGNYDLFIVAAADPSALQGLYSVAISGGTPAAAVYAATVPVGALPAPIPIKFATAGPASLRLVDLATPAPLSSVQAIVAQSGAVLLQASAAGSYALNAAAGPAQLFAVGEPGGTQGAYETIVSAAGATLIDVAEPVLASGSFGYAFASTLAAGGAYEVSVYDFQLPTAFSSLTAVAAQAGTVLATTQGTANFTAAAGPLNLLVFPALGSSGSANGLFSVQVTAQTSGDTAFETTQGVGGEFSSQTLDVTSAGSYDLTLTDLAFPANFTTLAVIATRGDSTVGEVIGGGKVSFNATPGTYVLNVLTQVGSGVDYGLFGLQLESTPPAPTVTFTATPKSVVAGQSVTLAWSATGATTCTASGGWSGMLGTSGSQPSAALQATTAFMISCTGSGGVATATATVNVTQSAKKNGGGGGFAEEELVMLLLAALLRHHTKRVTLKN
jgi:hypothetical protein